jgi:hypothetical protein
MNPGADLADQDISRLDILAAEALGAEPLAGAVAPVPGAAACFLMSHNKNLPILINSKL